MRKTRERKKTVRRNGLRTPVARRFLPALRQLRTADVPVPELAVHLWSARQTGSVLKPPPWELVDFHERGNTRAWYDDRFTLSYDRRTDIFSASDALERRAIYWTRDAETLPNYTSAAPMHRLLQGWLRTRGSHLLHSAAVGDLGTGRCNTHLTVQESVPDYKYTDLCT